MAVYRTALLVVVLAYLVALSIGAPAENKGQLAAPQKAPRETLQTANSYGYGYGYGGLYGGYGGYGGYPYGVGYYGSYGYPYYGYGYGQLYGHYPYYW